MKDLKQLRSEIDETDEKILSLFMHRMELCKGVADYKKLHSLPVFQGGREQEVIDRIKSLTANKDLEKGTAALFTSIMDISKILQNRLILEDAPDYDVKPISDFPESLRIGCQGTSGANSEAAAQAVFGERDFTFCRSFEDVFRKVQSGELDYGIVPVHNSTAGSVDSTYDLMAKYSVYIVREVCIEINHCLAAKSDRPLSEIKKVYSHPQALAQCSDFITANCLKTAEYSNTATAAAMVAESNEWDGLAAICSVECAENLGLKIIARSISDCSVNRTRFVCISREMQVSPDSDSIAVMLKIPHTEGSLYRLLTKFCVNGMNLLRIESRPIRDGSFDVLFYLDFSGRITDNGVKALLRDLEENLEYFRVLGTYRYE